MKRPPPDGELPLMEMTEADRARWMQQTRLRQLVMAEAEAWRSFAWAAGGLIGAFGLLPLDIWLAETFVGSHDRSTHPAGMFLVGMMLQMIAGLGLWVFGIRTFVRLGRWLQAIWQRRKFSSR